MKLRLLARDEIIKLYREQLPLDFSAAEIKPLEIIIQLFEQELYFGYGLYQDNKLIGYALLTKAKQREWLLLDYFAICSQYRNSGCGSLFLNRLKSELKKRNIKAVMIEIEKIACARNEEELEVRTKRKEFYLKNEITTTKRYATIFGTEFEVMYYSYDKEYKIQDIIEEYTKIYQSVLPRRLFEKNCFI